MNDDMPHGVVLTDKQARFVDEYLVDLNATQAAIRAGYSEKTAAVIGNENLIKPYIANAITKARAERSERTKIDQDYVIRTIVETIERCSQAKQVYDKSGELVMTETPDGSLAPAYKYDATNVLKGAELLGRHLVMFTDKVDNTSSDGSMKPVFNIVGVSPDDTSASGDSTE